MNRGATPKNRNGCPRPRRNLSGIGGPSPQPAEMAGTLLATALAVGLAELYSEILGTEVRTRQGVARARVGEAARNAGAVAFGISVPSVFFLLAVPGGIEVDTAFALAKWSGLDVRRGSKFVPARRSPRRQIPRTFAFSLANSSSVSTPCS